MLFAITCPLVKYNIRCISRPPLGTVMQKEATEQMARIIWGYWGNCIKKDEKNEDTWRALRDRMKKLNLDEASIKEPTDVERTALLMELKEANNERPRDWTIAIYGKAEAKKQRARMIEHLRENEEVLELVKINAKKEVATYYGLDDPAMVGYTEDVYDPDWEEGKINQYKQKKKMDKTTLLLEGDNTVPNQQSLSHVHQIMEANKIDNNNIRKALEQRDAEHQAFMERRTREHEDLTQQLILQHQREIAKLVATTKKKKLTNQTNSAQAKMYQKTG